MSENGLWMGLSIPAQESELAGEIELRPRKIEQWIGQLPLADIQTSAQQVYAYLKRLNRAPAPPAARFKALEQLGTTVEYLVVSMERRIGNSDLPLTGKSARVSSQADTLLNEAATGYKIVISDLAGGHYRFDKRLLAYAIHRALERFGRILLSAYKIYRPHPSRIWQEAHRLYHAAEKYDLGDVPVKAGGATRARATTPKQAYIHAVLLSAANPYRLRHGEAELVWRFFADCTEYAELFAERPDGVSDEHLYHWRLDFDMPPLAATPGSTLHPQYSRVLSVARLLSVVRNRLERDQSKSADTEAAVPKELLQRLLDSWEQRSGRGAPRRNMNAEIDMAVGISAVHHLVDVPAEAKTSQRTTVLDEGYIEPAGFEALLERETHFNVTPIFGGSDSTQRSHRAGDYPSNFQLVSLDQGSDEEIKIPEPSYQSQEWKTVNVSSSGYCLMWKDSAPSKAKVGELVGLHTDEASGRWQIGVIRWMQYQHDQGLKLGIELVAPQAKAVMVEPSERNRNARVGCLSLPQLVSARQPATLVTPARRYAVGEDLTIDDKGTLTGVRLVRLIETTADFTRFEYRPLRPDQSPFSEPPPHAQPASF